MDGPEDFEGGDDDPRAAGLAQAEPDVELTGDEAIDAALRDLVASERLPLEEQVPALDAVHQLLQERLAEGDG